MADQRNGGIAYVTDSWSPVRGCTRESPGCDNCFALAVTMPDKLVAFPGDRGTNGCVRAAEALGVRVVDEREPER